MEEASASPSVEKRVTDGGKHQRALQKGADILHTSVNMTFKFVHKTMSVHVKIYICIFLKDT